MNVLITAPSLDIKKNVSGISAVVNTIIKNNPKVNYIHFMSGKGDNEAAGLARVVPLIKSYKHLYQISKQNQYQILHLNLALNGKSLLRDYLVFKIAKRLKKPIITHLHGGKYLVKKPESKMLDRVIRDILKGSDKTLVLSEYEKDTVIKNYNAKNVMALANTVEKAFLEAEPNNTQDSTNFLFLGRLHESKGVPYVIEAFNKYLAAGNKGHLNICGTGPLEQLVIDSAANNDNITYHGIVSGTGKLQKITQNDVFLLPSLHGEGLPVALLECMAAGLVPIVTTDGSMGQIVTDMQNGVIVEKGDTGGLANAMQKIGHSSTLRQKISQNTKAYIKANFDVEKYIETLNTIYGV